MDVKPLRQFKNDNIVLHRDIAAVRSRNGVLHEFDFATGKSLGAVRTYGGNFVLTKGRRMLSAKHARRTMWNGAGEAVHIVGPDNKRICTLAHAASVGDIVHCDYFAYGRYKGRHLFWDANSGEVVAEKKTALHYHAACFTADGEWLFCFRPGYAMAGFRAPSWEQKHCVAADGCSFVRRGSMLDVDLSPSGELMVVVGAQVSVYRLSADGPTSQIQIDVAPNPKAFAFLSDTLITTAHGPRMIFTDLASAKVMSKLEVPADELFVDREAGRLFSLHKGTVSEWSIEDLTSAACKTQVAKKNTELELSSGTEHQLLEKIYADPADDDLRAVYGDVLSERGDPRGEFIQAQLSGDKKRAAHLLKQYGEAWLRPIRPVILKKGLKFRHGFVSKVVVRASFDEELAAVDDPMWATVESIRFDGWLSAGLLSRAPLVAIRSLLDIDVESLSDYIERPCMRNLTKIRIRGKSWDAAENDRALDALLRLPLEELTLFYFSAERVSAHPISKKVKVVVQDAR